MPFSRCAKAIARLAHLKPYPSRHHVNRYVFSLNLLAHQPRVGYAKAMIYAADLILPITSPPLKNGAVLVREGRIVAIDELDALAGENTQDEVRAFKGAVLMPGLVNLHSHSECASFDFLVAEPTPFSQWLGGIIQAGRSMKRDDWLKAARKGIVDSLAAGITCSADITRSGAGLQAAYEAGMPALIYLELVAVDDGNLIEAVVDILERIKSSEPITRAGAQKLGISPHSVYTLSESALKACADITREYHLPLSIHLAETESEVELVKNGSGTLARVIRDRLTLEVIEKGGAGMTPARFLDNVGLVGGSLIAAHGVWLNDDDIDLMRQKGATVAVCPTSNELLGTGEAPIARFVERNVRFGIGTDSMASNPLFDLFVEARKVRAILKKQLGVDGALTSRQLIEKMTVEAAKILGFADELGSIEPGKRADFIVVDTGAIVMPDPHDYLLDSASKAGISHTILGGEVVYAR